MHHLCSGDLHYLAGGIKILISDIDHLQGRKLVCGPIICLSAPPLCAAQLAVNINPGRIIFTLKNADVHVKRRNIILFGNAFLPNVG